MPHEGIEVGGKQVKTMENKTKPPCGDWYYSSQIRMEGAAKLSVRNPGVDEK